MSRLLLVLFFLAGLVGVRGQDDEGAPVAASGVFSAYDVRGVKRAGAGALATGGWRSAAFDATARVVAPFADDPIETDLALEGAHAWSDALALRVGVTEYFLGRTRPGGTRHSTTVGAHLTWKSPAAITWTFGYERDVRLRADTLEAKAAYSYPLTSLGAFLEFEAFGGAARGSDLLPDAAGPRIADTYQFVGAGVRLPYRVGAHTTIALDVRVSDAIGQDPAWSPVSAAGRLRAATGLGVTFDY